MHQITGISEHAEACYVCLHGRCLTMDANAYHESDASYQDVAYEATLAEMNEGFSDGTLMEFTEAELIAEVVSIAATDGKDQLTILQIMMHCGPLINRQTLPYFNNMLINQLQAFKEIP